MAIVAAGLVIGGCWGSKSDVGVRSGALLGTPMFTPSSGAVGDTITVTGTNVGDLFTGVSFAVSTSDNSLTAGSSFARIDKDTVTAQVPLGCLSGRIAGYVGSAGFGVDLGTFTVTSPGAPTITSFQDQVSNIRVYGTNFTGTTAVAIGGTAVTKYRLEGDGQLLLFPPSGINGTITITNTVGNVTSVASVTRVPRPVVTDISPTMPSEGDTLTLTGTGLDSITQIFCDNKLQLTPATQSATEITLVVPAGWFGCWLSLSGPAGGLSTAYIDFVPKTAPIVSGYSPTTGTIDTQPTLTGTKLGLLSGVEVDGVLVNGTASTDGTSYTFTLPSTTTAGVLKAVSPFGTQTLSPSFSLTVDPASRIDSTTPYRLAEGDTLTIKGAGFPDEVLTVYFPSGTGTIQATATRVDATTLTVVVPLFTAAGPISVSSLNSYAYGGFIEPILAAPTITDVTPLTAAIGDQITITGTNLLFAQAVRVGSTWVAPNRTYFGSLTFYLPAVTSGSQEVEVVTRSGSVISTQTFVVAAVPVLTSFSPVVAKPGDLVTVTGTALDQIEDLEVNGRNFNRCSSTCDAKCFCLVNPTQVTFLAPVSKAPALLTAYHPAGYVKSAQALTVSDGVPPIINYVSNTQLASGFPLVVFGDHFSGMLSVQIGGEPVSYTLANDYLVIQYDSSTSGAIASGKIKLTTVSGSVESAQTITMVPAPAGPGAVVIDSVTPAEVLPGDTIVVKGSGLAQFTSAKWSGGAAGSGSVAVKVVSDGELQITPTGFFRWIWLEAKNATLPLPVRSKAQALPQVVGFEPSTVYPGQWLRLFGVNTPASLTLEVGGQIWSLRQYDFAFTVPFDAVSGSLKAINELGPTATIGTVTVLPAAAAFTLSSPSAAIGDKVTISGIGLGDEIADLGGGPWNARRLDANTIEVIVPQDAATGVLQPCGHGSTPELQITTGGAPIVNAVYEEPFDEFTQRTLVGSNLLGTRRVSIGGRSLPFTVRGDDAVRVQLVPGLSNQPFVVENAQGRTVTSFSLAGGRPTVTSISKTNANVGDTITITGTNLGSVTNIIFAGVESGRNRLVTQNSSTSISFLVDAGMPSSRLQLWYEAVNRDPIEVTPLFTVNAGALPTVSEQVHVYAVSDHQVTVRGQNFTGLSAVTVGGVPAQGVSLQSSEQVTFVVPTDASSGPIVIKTAAGEVTAGQFTALDQSGPAATLTAATPSAGAPGTRVVLSGTQLETVTMRVGGQYFKRLIPGATKALFEVPAVTTDLRSGEIELVMGDGRVIKTGLQWTQLARLAVLDAQPVGAQPGDTITLTGDDFWGTTSVTIGGVAVDFTVVDNKTIEVTAPDAAVSGTIVVSKDDETFETTFSYSTTDAPDMAVSPDLSAPAGGDMATSATDDAGTSTVDSGSPTDGSIPDMTTGKPKNKGCTVGGDAPISSTMLLFSALLLARLLRRRLSA